jgi:hypothetical protein
MPQFMKGGPEILLIQSFCCVSNDYVTAETVLRERETKTPQPGSPHCACDRLADGSLTQPATSQIVECECDGQVSLAASSL